MGIKISQQVLFAISMMVVMSVGNLSCSSENEKPDDGSNNTTYVAVTGDVVKIGITYAHIDGFVNLNLITVSYTTLEIGIELSTDEDFVNSKRVFSNDLEGNKLTSVFDNLYADTKYYYRTLVIVNNINYFGQKRSFITKDFSNITSTGDIYNLTHNSATINCKVDVSSIDRDNNYIIGVAYSCQKKQLHSDSLFYTHNSGYNTNRVNIKACSLSKIQNNSYEISLSDLQAGNLYYYCSFTCAGNKYKLGEIKSFNTKDKTEGLYLEDSLIKLRLEVPKFIGGENLFIQHSIKIGNDSVMTYCLEYNPAKNHSRWIAFRFDSLTRDLGSGRTNAWADDPKLPKKYQVGSGAFSRYTRGHLCASYDRQYSKEANQQTFYMTNMSPMQYDFNSNYWTAYEQYVQGIGRDASFADTLYVVKGGTIDQTQGTVSSSNGKSIVVPRYYYIALLRFKAENYSAIGFWVEHKDYGYSGNKYAPLSVVRDKAVNIDDLEKKTGIDFFHNLPNLKEDALEGEDVETLKKIWF